MQRSNAETDEGAQALGHGGTINADICIIGAGSGGLSVAASTALLGMKVVLIEKHLMGGDCLNTGCVPSKALIAAARRAHDIRTAGQFGIRSVEPEVDPAALNDHLKSVIANIARNDSVERFTGMGVQVIQAPARFRDKHTVEAGDTRIKAFRFVIATGQSGNIWSRHWGDLVEMWRDGGALRLAGDRGTLVSAGAEVLTLTPRNTGTSNR